LAAAHTQLEQQAEQNSGNNVIMGELLFYRSLGALARFFELYGQNMYANATNANVDMPEVVLPDAAVASAPAVGEQPDSGPEAEEVTKSPELVPEGHTALAMLHAVRDLRLQVFEDTGDWPSEASHLEWASDSLDRKTLEERLRATSVSLHTLQERHAEATSELERQRDAHEQLQQQLDQQRRLAAEREAAWERCLCEAQQAGGPSSLRSRDDRPLSRIQSAQEYEDGHCLLDPLVKVGDFTQEEANEFVRSLQRTRDELVDMRKSMNGALVHLGAKLYSSACHFIRELIQNAVDNAYDEGCVPELRVIASEDEKFVLVTNNEVGFLPANVKALCSVGDSTKVGGHALGQKGLGFKSCAYAVTHYTPPPARCRAHLPSAAGPPCCSVSRRSVTW